MSDVEVSKYKNPIWQNKDNRHIVCEILQANGEYALCHVVAGPESEGGVNLDYDNIISEFGIEDLDVRTSEHKKIKEQRLITEKEEAEAKQMRMKQEVLFNMKLEAFENDLIQSSEDKDLKKLIRKSKTPIEVQAYATILIQRELEKNAK